MGHELARSLRCPHPRRHCAVDSLRKDIFRQSIGPASQTPDIARTLAFANMSQYQQLAFCILVCYLQHHRLLSAYGES